MSISDAFNDPEAIATADRARAASALDAVIQFAADRHPATAPTLVAARAELAALRASHALLVRLGEACRAVNEAASGDRLLKLSTERDVILSDVRLYALTLAASPTATPPQLPSESKS